LKRGGRTAGNTEKGGLKRKKAELRRKVKTT